MAFCIFQPYSCVLIPNPIAMAVYPTEASRGRARSRDQWSSICDRMQLRTAAHAIAPSSEYPSAIDCFIRSKRSLRLFLTDYFLVVHKVSFTTSSRIEINMQDDDLHITSLCHSGCDDHFCGDGKVPYQNNTVK